MSADGSSLDIVIPLYNEESVVGPLVARLKTVFSPEAVSQAGLARVRFRMVDDGSSDRTAALIAEEIRTGLPATLYRLSRNFGHQNAVSAGLDHCDGDYIAIMDADLQDPPELIWQMMEKLRSGFDVGFAQRRNRKEGVVRRIGYWGFYRMLAFLSDIPIPVDSGDFCLMTRRVADAIKRLPERVRFPRVLRAWVGFRQVGVEYDRPERQAGETKYSLGKLYRLATDGLAAASTRPLQIAQFLTFFFSFLSFAIIVGICFGLESLKSAGFAFPILIVLLLLCLGFAVQTLCLYVLGAYLGRTYLEVKGRPPYLVMEVVGGQEPTSK